jgi:hypothetical protein
MINTAIANRAPIKGDRISGMTVTFTDGFVWSGEFNATYGDGKVAAWLAGCDQDKVGAVLLNVTSDPTPTIALTFAHTAYLRDR